jgi:hypothetical protein
MYVLILDTETTGLFPPRKSFTEGAPILNPSTHRGFKGGSAPLPYAVQISYAVIDTSSPFFPIVEDYDAIIRISETTPLPEESVAIHGITREIIRAKGVPIEYALSILQRSLDTYDIQLVVGHNIAFDLRVLETEYSRCGIPSPPSSSPDPTSSPTPTTKVQAGGLRGLCPLQIKNSPIPYSNTLSGLPSLCTARESVGVCNLRVDSMYGGTYLKFGKLGQVFEILFKERDAARGVDMKVFEKYMHNSRVDVLMCARVYVWLCYSVDVFDAWYREMQNYADEDFINVDDSHLVGGVERPLRPLCGGGDDHPLQPDCADSNPESSASPSASPRRSDRLRLKRMREQEQEEGATSAPLRPPPCPSAQIKNNPLTSRGFKGDGVPLQEQGSVLAY